ncbi:MAG: ABC transporter ATP-binding protein [Candidatus Gastranaerophilaceae bacterium]|jgi:ATP-binding cassette subfamily B multidrug efflux pump|nr:ABC transporter ATP-binding protein [Christensenellales bacterium]
MRRILSYIRPYLRRMGIGLLIKFTGTIMDLALPWCLAYMIDDVVPLKDRGQIYLWGGMMLAFSAIAVINNIAANRMASRVARDATRNIRHDLYSRISMLSCRQYDDVTIPSLISRLTSDTYNMNRMLGMMQRIGVRAPILLLGGVTVTLILDARLSLVLLCTLPLIGLGIVLISRKGIPLYSKLQRSGDKMVRTVRDNVTGIRVIKALSKTEHERSRFESVNNEVVKAEKKAGMVMAATNPLMNMLLNVGLTFVIVTGAFLVQDGISEPGKIIAFLTYFTIILNAMLSINRIFVMYSQASASAKRIAEVLDTPFDMPLREADSITTQDHIRFENVSFSYNNVQDSLTDIDFTLGHGEVLGVMGATGSGKTTLILLLQRFYEASKGTVRIDGRNVNCIPGDELHTMFGIAFQSDTLFADTIRENIDFGRGLPMERIELAARCAQAYEFISSLPDGYNHMLTSKATNLSGGQKQRLLIARALAGSPKILILDDSSSALDYRTDAAMRQAVRESFPDTTTILIAQRVSSVRHADKIIMLDEGRIVGIGSHEQLMHTCPVYRETARTQMGVE